MATLLALGLYLPLVCANRPIFRSAYFFRQKNTQSTVNVDVINNFPPHNDCFEKASLAIAEK